jgi:hypothetical protein
MNLAKFTERVGMSNPLQTSFLTGIIHIPTVLGLIMKAIAQITWRRAGSNLESKPKAWAALQRPPLQKYSCHKIEKL